MTVGEVAFVVLPSPSCPLPLAPQAYTAPPATMARLWEPPARTLTTFASPVTRLGVVLVIVFPRPSWPELLVPQA